IVISDVPHLPPFAIHGIAFERLHRYVLCIGVIVARLLEDRFLRGKFLDDLLDRGALGLGRIQSTVAFLAVGVSPGCGRQADDKRQKTHPDRGFSQVHRYFLDGSNSWMQTGDQRCWIQPDLCRSDPPFPRRWPPGLKKFTLAFDLPGGPMRRFFLALILLTAPAFGQTATQTPAAGKRPFTFEDMMALKRIGGPAISPDSKWVLFSAVDVDVKANKRTSHLWIVPLAGGES